MTVPSALQRGPVVEAGARHRLPALIRSLGRRRVLLVTSRRRLRDPATLALLGGAGCEVFTQWAPNPTLEQGTAAAQLRIRSGADLVVGLGGGSAIDVAKMARSLPGDPRAGRRVVSGRAAPQADPIPLVAIPTTAGSGSEVTRFATVYVDGRKYSLDHPSVLPDYAFVDPELVASCPAGLRYSCAFDALCHAVESLWSVRASPASRAVAATALGELVELLSSPLADADLLRLAGAACRAGQAIDATRTTAAHAFSYRLTTRFAIPHGVACMLNMVWLADYNTERSGTAPLRQRAGLNEDLQLIRRSLAPPGGTPGDRLRAIMTAGGFSPRLGAYGVRAAHLDELIAAGMGSARSTGNPRDLDPDDIGTRLRALL